MPSPTETFVITSNWDVSGGKNREYQKAPDSYMDMPYCKINMIGEYLLFVVNAPYWYIEKYEIVLKREMARIRIGNRIPTTIE